MRSAGFAFGARGGGGASAGIDHGIDELEHGTLVGGRKLLDALQPLQEPRGLGCKGLAEGFHAEEGGGDPVSRIPILLA